MDHVAVTQVASASAGADEMLERQRATRNHMQGGEPAGEYSTYDQDTAELNARFQWVDVSLATSPPPQNTHTPFSLPLTPLHQRQAS